MRQALHQRKQQLNTLDQKIQGEAQKETQLKNSLDRVREQIRELRLAEDR